jgi:hypothetical protein
MVSEWSKGFISASSRLLFNLAMGVRLPGWAFGQDSWGMCHEGFYVFYLGPGSVERYMHHR